MASKIFIPAQSPEDWRKLLADPEKHWRDGFSAKMLAECWQNAGGFPPEIFRLFASTEDAALHDPEMLAAFPEHQVDLPPRGYPSQNDIFVLARDGSGELMTIMVEGKVNERFGETLIEWNAAHSPGKEKRLAFLLDLLGLPAEIPGTIRYQLLHRTGSAMLEAKRFNARSAVMIVHSFSKEKANFTDYAAFLGLYEIANHKSDHLYFLAELEGIKLYCGWASGD